MAYSKQQWTDGWSGAPINAARLNHIESGIDNAARVADTVSATITRDIPRIDQSMAQMGEALNLAVPTLAHATLGIVNHSGNTTVNVPVVSADSTLSVVGVGFQIPSDAKFALCFAHMYLGARDMSRSYIDVAVGRSETLRLNNSDVMVRSTNTTNEYDSVSWIAIPGGLYWLRVFRQTAGTGLTGTIRVLVWR